MRHADTPLVVAALAACLAAVTTGLVTVAADEAGDRWQAAVRQEVHRAASVGESARYVYGEQGPLLWDLEMLDARAEQLRRLAPTSGAARDLVEADARVEEEVAFHLRRALVAQGQIPNSEAVDLGQAYVRDRELNAEASVDPERAQSDGDAAAASVRILVRATLVAGASFLLAWLASALPGRLRLGLTGLAALLVTLSVTLAAIGVLA